MPSFKQRSYQKELLDDVDIPFEDIKLNMEELDLINSRLGGHAITLKGVQLILKGINKKQIIHILEIGCGGGDNLRVIKKWAEKNKLQIHLTGIDINIACISYAARKLDNMGIDFICTDYKKADIKKPVQIIFSSLFSHHFTNDELVHQIKWIKENAEHGFFINDLHRHPFPYYTIKLLTRIFSKSYLVKNDAPLSVLRGFHKKEWISIFNNAGIDKFYCEWKWAFRWLVTFKK